MNPDWEAVIGLEVHAQLSTESKLFSSAATFYGAPPNSLACALTLALPGTLPVPNAQAIELAVRFGLAIGAEINPAPQFVRKHYFYPDLPKGYQISQLEEPVVRGGGLDIQLPDAAPKHIRIQRAHLEEDAGKLLHDQVPGQTAVDLNRAGIPLLEIVSEPDMRSSAEALAYLRQLHQLVRYLEICDGNMQEGSFRCDVNVSLRRTGDEAFGTRVELKNLNSFRFIEQALDYEIERHIEVLERGEALVQETRLYDEQSRETRSMRGKETAQDYRYFPDPDLPPLSIEPDFIEHQRAHLPELPAARRQRFETQYELSAADTAPLLDRRALADYFEQACAYGAPPKPTAQWLLGPFVTALDAAELEVAQSPVDAKTLADLLSRVAEGGLSNTLAKELFQVLWDKGGSLEKLIKQRGLTQIDESDLESLIDKVLAENPKAVAQYRDGQTKVIGFLIGQIMQQAGGRANPKQVNPLLRRKLDAG